MRVLEKFIKYIRTCHSLECAEVQISTKKDEVVIGLMEISFEDWDRLNDRVQNIKRLVNTYRMKTNINN